MPVRYGRQSWRTGHRRRLWTGRLFGGCWGWICNVEDTLHRVQVDDAVDVIQFPFVLGQVVAKSRGLKDLVIAGETNGSAGENRLKVGIKLHPIGDELACAELQPHIALCDRDVATNVETLTVCRELQALRNLRNDSFSSWVT